MNLLPLAGLVGATLLSTIAITDALWHDFQNHAPPPWHFAEGYPWSSALRAVEAKNLFPSN